MIPTEEQAKALWEKYNVPEQKRVHLALVARVAKFLASKINQPMNLPLLLAAALLHDIDKNVPRFAGERHPDTAVRILKEEGMEEVAEVVKTHPLHAILDQTIAPKTLEEKILYLSDKMTKYDIVGVDGRYALWRSENLPPDAVAILDATYPKVKLLEKEMFSLTGIAAEEVSTLALNS